MVAEVGFDDTRVPPEYLRHLSWNTVHMTAQVPLKGSHNGCMRNDIQTGL